MTRTFSRTIWSVGQLSSRRGAGLGNEVFPWAKAYLGAAAFSAHLAEPPWYLNPRRYDRELEGARRRDAVRYILLTTAPSLSISVDMVEQTECLDYYDALTKIAGEWDGRDPKIIVHSSGMSLGYRGILRARPFLQSKILGHPGAIKVGWAMDCDSIKKIRVGVHLRGGDFQQSSGPQQGTFNQVVPVDWYIRQISSLLDAVGHEIVLYVAGDAKMITQLEEKLIPKTTIRRLRGTSVEDLAALALCDLVLPSISSFSMLSLFLSSALYTWPSWHLTEDDGYRSIWGSEESPKTGRRITQAVRHIDYFCGQQLRNPLRRVIVQSMAPEWPLGFYERLLEQVDNRTTRGDLIYHGSTREEN